MNESNKSIKDSFLEKQKRAEEEINMLRSFRRSLGLFYFGAKVTSEFNELIRKHANEKDFTLAETVELYQKTYIYVTNWIDK